MGKAFASLYVSAGVTLQAVTGTPAKVVALATAGPSAGGSTGGNTGVVADTTNKQLKLRQGDYKVSLMLAANNASEAQQMAVELYKNDVAQPGLVSKTVGVGSSGCLMFQISGIVSISAADVAAGSGGYATLDARILTQAVAGSISINVTPTYGELSAIEI